MGSKIVLSQQLMHKWNSKWKQGLISIQAILLIKIFGGGDYNTNVLKYFNEHPNSGLELYSGPGGDLILIKRTAIGVQQYDGQGGFFNSAGFDKYASKMYWRRY